LAAREKQLKRAEEDAIDLAQKIQAMSDWVTDAENALSLLSPISRVPNEIQRQVSEHASFLEMSQAQRAQMVALTNRGLKVQMTCEKKDTIPIKNQLVSLKNRNERISQRAIERAKLMDAALKEAQDYFNNMHSLSTWCDQKSADLTAANAIEPTTGERIREQIDTHHQFANDLANQQSLFDDTYASGRQLVDRASNPEKRELGRMNEALKDKWTQLVEKSAKR
jgi:dystonin